MLRKSFGAVGEASHLSNHNKPCGTNAHNTSAITQRRAVQRRTEFRAILRTGPPDVSP